MPAARETHGSQLREAPTPLDAVLFTIEIEVVETGFGDRYCPRGCGREVSMPDMLATAKSALEVAAQASGQN